MTTFTFTQGAAPIGRVVVVGQRVPAAPSTLSFDLDETPSIINDAGDYVVVCVSRPAAQGANSQTLVLTPDQVAMLDGYVVQTGMPDVPTAIANQVINLIRGLVQSAQSEQQAVILAAVAGEIAKMQVT